MREMGHGEREGRGLESELEEMGVGEEKSYS
jgi:hypothetical protein